MWRAPVILLAAVLSACGSGQTSRDPTGYSGSLTISQVDELRDREALLPIAPDSVIERYLRYPPDTFHREFAAEIGAAALIVDSLNRGLPSELQIDTLAIDHTFENIGVAGRTRTKLALSSSFFYMYGGVAVLRSVITHEFGHIHYDLLGAADRAELESVWDSLRQSALFYVYNDGEYSSNARFGGHPMETPEELFASAFNLYHNNVAELQARIQYVDPRHHAAFDRLRALVERRDSAARSRM